MNKFCTAFFSFVVFMACNNPTATNSATSIKDTPVTQPDTIVINNNPAADLQQEKSKPFIIPGESIGKIALGTNALTLENILGKPDMSDAAMGKAWTTWYSKKPDAHNNKTELNIYTAYKDTGMREQTVQQIRTTSSFFETKDSIYVYSSLKDIKSKYVLQKAGEYTSDGITVMIYDDKKQGIAFEVAAANKENFCTGIVIHQKNRSVNDIYIMLHPDMKRFDK